MTPVVYLYVYSFCGVSEVVADAMPMYSKLLGQRSINWP